MRLAISALLLLCACGTLSNEDVAFREALPQKEQLHVQVQQGNAATVACAIGRADTWISAKATGDNINAGVAGIGGLVDAINAVTPTTRDTRQRPWGPFGVQTHAGADN